MADLPRVPAVDALVDRFIAAGDPERLALLAEFDALDDRAKEAAYRRLLGELEGRFAPASDFAAPFPGSAPSVRAWLLSALRVTGPPPHAIDVLQAHVSPSREPSEIVRYWALVNLHVLAPNLALRTAAERRDESEAVGALTRALLAAQDRTEAVDDIRRRLGQWRRAPQDTWLTLRALRLVPVPQVTAAVYELLQDLLKDADGSTQGRYALTYDVLLALARVGQAGAIAGLPPDLIVRVVRMAAEGAEPHHLRAIASALGHIDAAPRTTIAHALTAATDLPPAVRAALRDAGLVAALQLPAGADRIELAYHLVLKNPARFEVLETLNPADLRQMAEGLLGSDTGPEAVSALLTRLRSETHGPGALWRAWVETTQPARLTQD